MRGPADGVAGPHSLTIKCSVRCGGQSAYPVCFDDVVVLQFQQYKLVVGDVKSSFGFKGDDAAFDNDLIAIDQPVAVDGRELARAEADTMTDCVGVVGSPSLARYELTAASTSETRTPGRTASSAILCAWSSLL